jgi:hypothetical protein
MQEKSNFAQLKVSTRVDIIQKFRPLAQIFREL